jgi:cysteinyl-tRNA synthetase
MKIYNSISREKELFVPIHDDFVGMYVCGPTVYSDVHLGNCRTFVSFDIIYRYLMYLGYKVRYVRNITDVGHLEGDADSGAEDKIAQKARKEKLEPMEVVQKYAEGFHAMMRKFNVLAPSIEPRATGHIIEQIEMVKKIIENGYGYEKNGSVYFDTIKLVNEGGNYGQLSGRKIDELLVETREELKNQDEKRHPSDFAIWVKASPSHLMRWPSPWSEGYPGWHLECSAMSTKYLGERFDIHGGGNDLKFPHHENEIAQNLGACKCTPANYWIHGNMLLLNGKKMAKSDGNSITPVELFSGNSPHVSKGYSPMVVRFFMLQTHYRSTLDLTDDGLQAAEKGYKRLFDAMEALDKIQGNLGQTTSDLDLQIEKLLVQMKEEMDDDFNTPKALAVIFELVTLINGLKDGHLSKALVMDSTFIRLRSELSTFLNGIFGLDSEKDSSDDGVVDGLMELIISMRQEARSRKDWAMSDHIRDVLKDLNLQIKDGKDGTTWSKL